MKTLQSAIAEAIENNGINGTINPSNDFSIIDETGKERYQVIDEDEIDEICENRKDYDGLPCASFKFEGVEYFFVKQ